jgi:hypothetical protein
LNTPQLLHLGREQRDDNTDLLIELGDLTLEDIDAIEPEGDELGVVVRQLTGRGLGDALPRDQGGEHLAPTDSEEISHNTGHGTPLGDYTGVSGRIAGCCTASAAQSALTVLLMDPATLVDYLAEHTGLRVSDETIRRALKQAGIVLSRPQHKISSPDPDYQVKKRRLKIPAPR